MEQDKPTVLSYLNDHLFDENLSLTALAGYFGVSESVVSRKIRSMTNSNFLDYVNKKRIEHSAILLLSTDVSVNDLSKTVGYGNDITFRRLFKKYMGITPSEYRRKKICDN
ncbi:MAG: helix-turn-helix domain-containing protein [Holdemania massiliensis]